MRIFRRQSTKLWVVLSFGIAISVAGIAYAIWFGSAVDGGRGGALAVAAAFYVLFTSTPTLEELIEAPDDLGEPGFEKLLPDAQISRLQTAFSTMIDSQRRQNLFLAITSIFGTLVWAFGDIVATLMGANG